MKPIPGLTMDEQTEVIMKVASNHKTKFFGIYSPDDIMQETWVIILQKIGDFTVDRGRCADIKKSLEHWLNTVVSNRLRNLYRDKHLVPQRMIKGKKDKTPNNLMSPLDITYAMEDTSTEFFENVNDDLWEKILTHMDPVHFDILDSVLSGEVISSYYKSKMYKVVKEIINEQASKQTRDPRD